MTVTQNEQLIINLGKGTRIFEKDHVKKALEAYEPKPTCANYERDNKEETKWFDITVLKAAQEHYMQSKKAYGDYIQNNPLLSEMEQNITPASSRASLCVVPIETESKTTSTAIPDIRFCSVSGIPSFSKVFTNSGSKSSIDLGPSTFFLGAE